MRRAGPGGHKEINRTNLSLADCRARLAEPLGKAQLALLKMRNTSAAFSPDADIAVSCNGSTLAITWRAGGEAAALHADLAEGTFEARITDMDTGREKESITMDCLQ